MRSIIIIITAIIHLHLHRFAIAIAISISSASSSPLPAAAAAHPAALAHNATARKQTRQAAFIHPSSQASVRRRASRPRCLVACRAPGRQHLEPVSGELYCVGRWSDRNHRNECVVAGEVVTTTTFGAISAGDRESRG